MQHQVCLPDTASPIFFDFVSFIYRSPIALNLNSEHFPVKNRVFEKGGVVIKQVVRWDTAAHERLTEQPTYDYLVIPPWPCLNNDLIFHFLTTHIAG